MYLTEQQIEVIWSSYDHLRARSPEVCDYLFNKLFQYDPGLRTLFGEDMREHGQTYWRAFGMLVARARNFESLEPVLKNLANRHADYGVTPKHYTLFGNAMLFAFKMVLEEAFDKPTRQAWVAFFRLMSKYMKHEAYGEAFDLAPVDTETFLQFDKSA
ncbi:MAG: hemin receptor [Gammaproteobacteria bacterium]|nr:hemin receptor [Gammaproteobacteria bacterium]